MYKKITPFDEAISFIIGIYDNIDSFYCPFRDDCKNKSCLNCDGEKFRTMFKERANIKNSETEV